MEMITAPVLVLVGPTAIGKTELSLELADSFNAEVVSVDSMQVYRYMDIGTAKPTRQERGNITHHLLDIVDPDDEYNVSRFCNDALEAISAIHGRGAIPLLTGGTGMYLKSLRQGVFSGGSSHPEIRQQLEVRISEEGSITLHEELARHDPASAERIAPNDKTRIIRGLEVFYGTGTPLSVHFEKQAQDSPQQIFTNMKVLGLTCARDELYERINRRSELMLGRGLEDEVRQLLELGYPETLRSMQSIGYRHMLNHLRGDWDRPQTIELLARDTRHYAKRQYTWFNKDRSVEWFQKHENNKLFTVVKRWLEAE